MKMLDPKIQKKLDALTELPTIPTVMSQVLSALDNPNLSATQLASIIERDQTLTAKVLRVANSPFYGFARRISTIDLAVVILGINVLKEIVLSLLVQKFFSRLSKNMFDVKSFWNYSLFCGSSARLIARKLGYKLAGEAFVAGLMHDLGILIIIENFRKQFGEIRKLQKTKGMSLVEAEMEILQATHSEVGLWLAEKWNLPPRLCLAIKNHHLSYKKLLPKDKNSALAEDVNFHEIEEPLTAIVSLSEWFAQEMGFKEWDKNYTRPDYYLSSELFEDLSDEDILHPESAFELLKKEMVEEYQKAAVISDLQIRA